MDENQEYINNVFNIPDESQNQAELSDFDWNNISNEDLQYGTTQETLDAWGWKRIVAAVASIGASELAAKITKRDPETLARINNPGGTKWTKKEADKFYKRLPGKVETIISITNHIIGTDQNSVKPNQLKHWASLLADAIKFKKYTEDSWVLLQNYSKDFNNSENRAKARTEYVKIFKMEIWANKADEQRHIWSTNRTVDKAAQSYKTLDPTAITIRTMYLLFIKGNFFNLASVYKLASIRNNSEYQNTVRYTFKRLGGNRTKFDKAVEKGYKKKPIFGKKMDIDWNNANFDGFNADGETGDLISQEVIKANTAASTGAGALIASSVPSIGISSAIGAGIGTVIGGIMAVGFGQINKMHIKKANEKALESSDATPTQAEIDALKAEADQALKDAKIGDSWIPKVPNWLTVTIPIVLTLATLTIVYRKQIFKK